MPAMTTGPGTVYIMTTTAGQDGTWGIWNQAWTSIGTTAAGTWIAWNTGSAQQAPSSWERYVSDAETDGQRAERERQAAAEWDRIRQQQEERRDRIRQQQEAVRAHAEELLVSLLSPEQEADWRAHGWFTVRGSGSSRAYRIRRGIAGNVDLLTADTREPEVTYCAHPPGIPAEDVCLAQMLLLATDEDAFLRVANASPARRDRPPLRAVA